MKKILLSSFVAVFLLTGCGEEKKVEQKEVSMPTKVEEVKKVEVKKPMETKTPEEKLVAQVKESTSKVADQIAKESEKVAKIGSEAVKSVSEKLVSTTEDVTKEVVAVANETKSKIEESINTIVATKKEEAKADSNEAMAKGKSLYLKCAGCHGANAEKPALGKSEVVKGWDKAKIIKVLKGYKDGSYGGVMKGVMISQVTNLSDEEIDALGAYISTL